MRLRNLRSRSGPGPQAGPTSSLHHPSPRRWLSGRFGRAIATAAAVATIATGMTAISASPASAEVVARSNCASYGDLGRGQCFDYGPGYTWLGTYKNAGGEEFFCIDKNKSAHLPANAPIKSTNGLKNKFGQEVGERAIAGLNYIIWRWGDTDNNNRAAAIHLIVREVMSDTAGDLPSGLGINESVKTPTGMSSSHAIMTVANEMWEAAKLYHGNWQVNLANTNPAPGKVGEPRTISGTVTSRNGFDATSLGVPNQTLSLSYTGGLTGPAQVTTDANGNVAFNVVPTVQRSTGTVSTSLATPAKNGKIFDPTDNSLQRGWIPKQDVERASVPIDVVTLGEPTITTMTSDTEVYPGVSFFDNVDVQNTDGTPRTATAYLWGPYEEQPTVNDCQPADLAREVTFDVAGPGTYQTPEVTITEDDGYGYYVWTEYMPAAGTDSEAATPCGLVEETTLVTLRPEASTQVSNQSSKVFEQLHDTIKVTGINGKRVTAPGIPIEWDLHGPLAPIDGSCAAITPEQWEDAPIIDSDTIHVTADGEYKTRTTQLKETGCYSYGEHILPTPESQEFFHPVGHVTQTTLTGKSTVTVRTMVNKQVAVPGVKLFDKVEVKGIVPGDTVTVNWTLYGPAKKGPAKRGKNFKCKNVDWTGVKVFDTGSFVATADGMYKTVKSKKLKKAGCYTYAEYIPEDTGHTTTTHEPGKPSQTTTVTLKTPPGKPKIPTGPRGLTTRQMTFF